MTETRTPPAFQFYASDFLADDAVSLMTNEQIGAYVLLLCQSWQRPDGLPAAMSSLARLARCTTRRFESSIWPAIKGCWLENEQGLFYNRRLEAVRKEQDEYREQKRRAGRKSAERRQREGNEQGNEHPNGKATPLATETPTEGQREPQRNVNGTPNGDPNGKATLLLQSPSPGTALRTNTVPQSARSTSPEASARAPEGASMLAGNRAHRAHAACGRPCMPAFLHEELRGRLGGAQDVADRALRDWYQQVWTRIGDAPVLEDPVRFWKAQFEAWHGAFRVLAEPAPTLLDSLCEAMVTRTNRHTVNTWIRPCEVVEAADSVTLRAPSEDSAAYLRKHYGTQLREAVGALRPGCGLEIRP